MKYIEDPWDYRGDLVYFPKLRGGFSVGSCPHPETTAKRIVTCVNACAGMVNPSTEIARLKQGIIDLSDQYAELEQQRDALLDIINAILIRNREREYRLLTKELRVVCEEAISKAGDKA